MPDTPILIMDGNGQLWAVSIGPDGLIETTQVAEGTPTFNPPSVQEILDGVAQDARQVLTATAGPDQSILLDYADRVHAELLRLTHWRFLLSPVLSFQTQEGKTDYWIGVGTAPTGTVDCNLDIYDFWRIKQDSVIDRTNHRVLTRIAEEPPAILLPANGRPTLWRNDPTTPYVFNIYPQAGSVPATIEFRYYKARKRLLAATDHLQIPIEYKDVVIAGVNELVCVYLKRAEEAIYWRGVFEEGKRDMIRDTHAIEDRNNFIKPDPAAVGSSYHDELFIS
jgi:hypothetical protein